MSNPGINRWGSNLFWYNFWFKDKNNSSSIHLDSLINDLMYTYTKFGLYSSKSLFLSRYRSDENSELVSNHLKLHDLVYFRAVEFKNRVLDEVSLLKIRISPKSMYKSRIWIMRFQNWLVINFYCFQPLKKKRVKKGFTTKKSVDLVSEKEFFPENLFFKYKVFSSIFFKKIYVNKPYYLF